MRRRSLFTGDVAYRQRRTLDFVNQVTELRYQGDISRLVKPQLGFLACFIGVAALVEAGLLAVALVISLSLCSALQGRAAYQVRLCWSLPILLSAQLLWQQEEKTWSAAQELLRQFPGFLASNRHTGFFTVRHWPTALAFSLSEALAFICMTGVPWSSLLIPTSLYLSLHCFLQRDLKDLWSLMDSFRQSDNHYSDVINNSLEAYYVTNDEGVVFYTNIAGRHMAAALNVPDIRYGTSNLFSFFQDENTVKLREMLKESNRKEGDEKEMIIQKLPAGKLDVRRLRGLGVMARSQPCVWKERKTTLFAFEDVSLYIARRHFLSTIYRDLHISVMHFSQQLEDLSCLKYTISAKELFSFYQLYTEYGNSLLLQYYYLGKVEIRREPFHLHTEIENVMEFISFRAHQSNIDLLLSREEGFPSAAVTDKLRHTQLLTNLLSFVVDQAKEGSEIAVYCAVAGAQGQEFLLSYRVNFVTSKLTQSVLNELLVTRKGESHRRSLMEVITLKDLYGVSILAFDMLLQVLRGLVTMAYVEKTPGKATVMFTVPVNTHTAMVPSTPLILSTGRQITSALSIRWKAGNLHFLSSTSLPELITYSSAAKIKRGLSEVYQPRRLSHRASGEIERIGPQPPPLHPQNRGVYISLSPSSSSSGSIEDVLDGDTITVQMLAISGQSQTMLPDPEQETEFQSTQKVLIVDENPSIRRILKAGLSKSGYLDCDEAKDKTEALQMYRLMSLQKSRYMAIFVTTGKASRAGESFVREVRGLEGNSDFARTFICGIPAVTDADQPLFDCFSKGYAVTRPSSESELRDVIRQAASH